MGTNPKRDRGSDLPTGEGTIDRILVPIDGSTSSEKALTYAIDEFEGATLVAIHVITPVEDVEITEPAFWYEELLEQKAKEGEMILEDARRLAEGRGVELTTHLLRGPTARTVLEAVERLDVDHVVMGSRGRTGIDRLLLGSVAETVVRRAPVPVTVVR